MALERSVVGYVTECTLFVNAGIHTRWRSWLRHCVTSRKVAGSIPDGDIEIFH